MSKKDKSRGQWHVLWALSVLPPFGADQHAVLSAMTTLGCKGSPSGTRSRLKELCDIGLVLAVKPKGAKYKLYWMTEDGWLVFRDRENGLALLRNLRAAHATLEAQRAVELAPIKAKWDDRIKAQMSLLMLSVKRVAPVSEA